MSGASLKAEMLPALEIEAASRFVLRENGAADRAELCVGIARLLGYQRTGTDLKARIDAVVGRLISCGQLRQDLEARLTPA